VSRLKLLALVAGLFLTFSSTAMAGGIKAKPWSYDPDKTGCGTGAWVTHEGLPDSGNSDHALYLTKFCATATNAAGGATIDGVQGIELTEIGWDVRDDGHCGAGAPRFNVVTSDDVTHFIGCSSPPPLSASVQASGWTRFRYDPATAFPPIAPGSTVKSIDIVFDEGIDQGQGFVYVDNIDINGTLIGKPGNA
jgi:hypothetical protein